MDMGLIQRGKIEWTNEYGEGDDNAINPEAKKQVDGPVPRLDFAALRARVAGIHTTRDEIQNRINNELDALEFQSSMPHQTSRPPSSIRSTSISLNCLDTMRDTYQFIDGKTRHEKVLNFRDEGDRVKSVKAAFLTATGSSRSQFQSAFNSGRYFPEIDGLPFQSMKYVGGEARVSKYHKQNVSDSEIRSYQMQNPSLIPGYHTIQTKGKADVETIDFNHKKLGDQYIQIMADGLRANKMAKNMLFRDCRLTDKGFVPLFQALSSSHAVTKVLDLSENVLGPKGAEALEEFIMSARSLAHLSMMNTKMTDTILTRLVVPIETSRIMRLDLAENRISDAGAKVLASLLSKGCDLTELDLGWNSIHFEGAIALARAIQTNNKLCALDLSWNSIGGSEPGAQLVAEAFSALFTKNTTLVHLDLSQNHLRKGEFCFNPPPPPLLLPSPSSFPPHHAPYILANTHIHTPLVTLLSIQHTLAI